MDSNQQTLIDTIKKAGLTEPQAKAYLALVDNGALTPAKLAEITGETRTNSYAITDKLEKLGIIHKTNTSKAEYVANHPTSLEALAETRRKVMSKNEQVLKANLSNLIDIFYTNNEMPGARTLAGIDGIKEVYNDTLETGKDIYLLRTTADAGVMNKNEEHYFHNYRVKRAKLGINTYAIAPDTQRARRHIQEGVDKELLLHRTLIPQDEYTASVEIDVYGDKVALIAFGDTQMATIINSPLIAEAMRQVLQLLGKYLPKPSV